MGICYSSMEERRRNEKITTSTTETEMETEREITPAKRQRQGSGRWKKLRDTKSCQDDVEVDQVSGMMCSSGASNTACLYTQQGKKGTNQDAMLVWENFSSRSDTIFCGVFDGHGPLGHMVSKKVRDSLPLKLSTQWRATVKAERSCLDKNEDRPQTDENKEVMNKDDQVDVEEREDFPDKYQPLKHAMLKAFRLTDTELKSHPTIDCFCSGTTAVTLIKQGNDLVIGNVGDSRAVLAMRDEDNSLIAVQLTVDLKPDLPREAARIQQCKGRVFALQDEPEVARVWLPNSDSPGLAMARAFGDFCLKDYGLISVPDVFYRCLTERDAFIILASDGIWDVLSNKEAIDVVASAPSRDTAARALVDSAVRGWKLKYPTSKTDDCAVVCLFLEDLSLANNDVVQHDRRITSEKVVVADNNDAVLAVNGNSHASTLGHATTLVADNNGATLVVNENSHASTLDHATTMVADNNDAALAVNENSHASTLGHATTLVADNNGATLVVNENSHASILDHATTMVADNNGATLVVNENSHASTLDHATTMVADNNDAALAVNENSHAFTLGHATTLVADNNDATLVVNENSHASTLDHATTMVADNNGATLEVNESSHASTLDHATTLQSSNEIVPARELTEETMPDKHQAQTVKTLAECISVADEDEWSALEGLTRVNSLLSLPRFLSGDRRSASWRKWL